MTQKKEETINRDRLASQRTQLAVERTRLANERTFTAWIRTGITGVGGGFAIHRFVTLSNQQHQQILHAVAQLLILWGIGIFIFALFGYLTSCKRLYKSQQQEYSKVGVTLLTFAIVLFASILLLITFVGRGK